MENLSDIGEKGFVNRILTFLKPSEQFVNGFGHDASIIDIGLDSIDLVLKIDRAARPLTIMQGYGDYKIWGQLAVTANCSDILACGGNPKGFMISLCLPGDWKVKDAEDIILGCQHECEKRGISFLGGDTKEGKTPQVVGCALGDIPKGKAIGRTNVRAGDYIVLSGRLGGFMGSYLQLLYNSESDDSKRKEWLEYIINPVAKWEESAFINSLNIAKSGMDASDGLLDVLRTLGRVNNVGVEIELNNLPLHQSAVECSTKLDIDPIQLGFSYGDWNIVYTISEKDIKRIETKNLEIHIIGRIVEHSGVFGTYGQDLKFLIDGNINEHFRRRMEDLKKTDILTEIKNQVTLTQRN